MGKFLAIVLVTCGIIAGGAMYYLQVYAYYSTVVPNGSTDVVLKPLDGSVAQAIAYSDYKAIDSNSSPIRYRACFTAENTADELKALYVTIKDAEPLVAPGWFDCFDAKEIGAAIESQSATSFLSIENVSYGIDRIVSVLDDGRGYAWNKINRCGKIAFAGKPLPPDCPTPPESN
ncbi:histidine kinase [Rhodobacteraceae bacterium Araon29]|tara:strand:- start:1940 stop:2464 length:525 start_codon:yes stop_codon:yes gene_type:complete